MIHIINRSFLYYLDGNSLLLKPINITIKPLIDHVSIDHMICHMSDHMTTIIMVTFRYQLAFHMLWLSKMSMWCIAGERMVTASWGMAIPSQGQLLK